MRPELRLRAPSDFARLRQEGSVVHHRAMTLSFSPNGLGHNRYGYITGKSLGKAVQRNRVRRLLREAVRQLHPHLHSGYDIVWIARRPVVGQPLVEVQRIVDELLHRAGVVESEHPTG